MTVAPKTDLALFRSASGAVEKATARRGVERTVEEGPGGLEGARHRRAVLLVATDDLTQHPGDRVEGPSERPDPAQGSRTRDTTASPASTNRFHSSTASTVGRRWVVLDVGLEIDDLSHDVGSGDPVHRDVVDLGHRGQRPSANPSRTVMSHRG